MLVPDLGQLVRLFRHLLFGRFATDPLDYLVKPDKESNRGTSKSRLARRLPTDSSTDASARSAMKDAVARQVLDFLWRHPKIVAQDFLVVLAQRRRDQLEASWEF